jgi:hypothetical protein
MGRFRSRGMSQTCTVEIGAHNFWYKEINSPLKTMMQSTRDDLRKHNAWEKHHSVCGLYVVHECKRGEQWVWFQAIQIQESFTSVLSMPRQ